MLFNSADQTASLAWQPALREGAIRLFVHDSGVAADGMAIALQLEPARGKPPTFVIDKMGYASTNVSTSYGAAKRTPGWHLVAFELADRQVRVFVDDVCVGQSIVDSKEAVDGLRVNHSSGTIFIDEIVVSRRVPSMPRPASIKDQDSLWLEQGEQLFGRIVSADRDKVLLDAKFGQRTFAWSRLRGILFARSEKPKPAAEMEITYRPGPGFLLDRVRAKLVRWDGDRLVVAHPLLGEIPIERDRVDKIRPVTK
jgi:hypothetical protein